MKDGSNKLQVDETTEACIHDISIVQTLTEAITTRWQEAHLEPSPDDDVKAGLAALEFLEAVRDSDTPWDLGQVASIIDIDRGIGGAGTCDQSTNAAS